MLADSKTKAIHNNPYTGHRIIYFHVFSKLVQWSIWQRFRNCRRFWYMLCKMISKQKLLQHPPFFILQASSELLYMKQKNWYSFVSSLISSVCLHTMQSAWLVSHACVQKFPTCCCLADLNETHGYFTSEAFSKWLIWWKEARLWKGGEKLTILQPIMSTSKQ